MRARLGLLAMAGLAGCGIGFADDSSGGHDQLPVSGAGPWRRLPADPTSPADEPWLATDPVLEFTEPAVVGGADGGYLLFVTREPAGSPAGDTQIWRGELPAAGQLVTPLEPVLEADRPWEEGHVGDPAIVVTSDRLVMFYTGGTGVGRADSTDGGRTWTKWPAPVITDARSPGAAYDGATWLVAFVDGAGAIGLARSPDGHDFVRDPDPLLTARADAPGAFDHAAVTQPALAWLVEGTGRGHWALWYAGLAQPPAAGDAPAYAVGYAASWDGQQWDRLAGDRPVVAAPADAPAVFLDGNHGVMAFGAINGRRPAIALAITP
ncbi:MAG: hypothetical protein R3B06_01575 [Kofleriaceae bacterium]